MGVARHDVLLGSNLSIGPTGQIANAASPPPSAPSPPPAEAHRAQPGGPPGAREFSAPSASCPEIGKKQPPLQCHDSGGRVPRIRGGDRLPRRVGPGLMRTPRPWAESTIAPDRDRVHIAHREDPRCRCGLEGLPGRPEPHGFRQSAPMQRPPPAPGGRAPRLQGRRRGRPVAEVDLPTHVLDSATVVWVWSTTPRASNSSATRLEASGPATASGAGSGCRDGSRPIYAFENATRRGEPSPAVPVGTYRERRRYR